MSAYIKMVLTQAFKKELNQITENGMTVASELEIINSDLFEKAVGPFNNAKDLIAALNKKSKKKLK